MKLLCEAALLPEGWALNVGITIDTDGRIAAVMPGSAQSPDAQHVPGYVVPGMANVHSHAFQRVLAGRAERRNPAGNSFWTWRDAMYTLAARLDPEQMEAIAAFVYVEMLLAGYTAVGEFHYLHNDADGNAYADRAEMSQRLISAAASAGIALTLLPVAYGYSGFGAQPATAAQRRFVLAAADYAALVTDLRSRTRDLAQVEIGVALHSLRAIDASLLRCGLELASDPVAPVHIHVAETMEEVRDCIAWSGAPPVQWLLDNAPVDERWCLVHATHVTEGELARLVASEAVAGLCPTTEANLGDGVFPARGHVAKQGRFAIGSDSHVSVSAAEELRLLEYGQRLLHRERAVLATLQQPSPGEHSYVQAAQDGARALGRDSGRICAGACADLVVLDGEHPVLSERGPETVLDGWIFGGDARCVRHVMVAGRWAVRDRQHAAYEDVVRRFRATLRTIRA